MVDLFTIEICDDHDDYMYGLDTWVEFHIIDECICDNK